MYSAQQIKNFIPQNPSLNAPRRIDVKLPTFEQTINAHHGFPLPKDVDGGLKYEVTSLEPLNNAASYNAYNAMYPCIPQKSSDRMLNPEPIADTMGLYAPYGYGRGQPKGIASIKKRDALFDKTLPLTMSTQSQLAPMMKLTAF
mgnify:CR=1 FL=1